MGCTLLLCLRDAGSLGGNDAADDAVNAPASCALPAPLTFGPNGGMVRYQDEYTLDPQAGMSITRTYYGRADIDGAAVRTCAPALPVCGASGLVSLANIVADLSATDVQAAFGNAPNTVYGRDDRPVDGTVFSIRYAERGTLLVGSPCTSSGSTGCLASPVGVLRLADDLNSLASAALADAECKNL
jgi:hypothetical protein